MGWDPFGDIGDFFVDVGDFIGDTTEDIGVGIEKFGRDVWESEVTQVAVPTAIGAVIAGPAGAAAGASYGLSSLQQEKAIEEAEKMQEKQIAAQKEMQEKQIELETLKMEEAKQLADVFTKQDQPLYIAPAPIQVPLAQVPLAKPSLFVVGIVCLVAFFIWKRYPWSN